MDYNSNKCPVCGGDLVWDYESGEIVCSRCGLVVDRIYDYGATREREDTIEWREVKIKSNPRKNKILHRYRLRMKLYVRAKYYVRDKPWLEIDYDKLLRTGRMIRSIKSTATIKAEKNIEEKNLWSIIDKGIEFIEKHYPIALARSGRGKYALAYIIYNYIWKNHIPDPQEVTSIFNISETSYKRLLKLAKKIVSIKASIINK
jgi:uncharacterized Zn finger protein (UPF0148 family)